VLSSSGVAAHCQARRLSQTCPSLAALSQPGSSCTGTLQ
jgi:hypothetical protein